MFLNGNVQFRTSIQVLFHKNVFFSGCKQPAELLHGSILTDEGPLEIGGKAYYSCDAGFVLDGELTRECGKEGWDFQEPICRPIGISCVSNISKLVPSLFYDLIFQKFSLKSQFVQCKINLYSNIIRQENLH